MKRNLFFLLMLSSVAWAKQVPAPEQNTQMVNDCVEQLKIYRPHWPINSLQYVCKRSDPECLAVVAPRELSWDSFTLTHACEVSPGQSFDQGCTARALNAFTFSARELGNFCRSPQSECILTYKEARPETSKTISIAACAYGITHTCPAQLAGREEAQNLSTLEINQACRSAMSEVCPLELAKTMNEKGQRLRSVFIENACKKLDNTCPSFLVAEGKKWNGTDINQVCRLTDFACVQQKIHYPEIKSRRDLIKACFKKPEGPTIDELLKKN